MQWSTFIAIPGDGKDIPRYIDPPVIPGHEFSGTVVALGEGAKEKHGVEVGDLTVSEQIVPCKDCRLVLILTT